jgi:DNA relaxase NicK
MKAKVPNLICAFDTSSLKPTIYSPSADAAAVSLPAAATAAADGETPTGNTGNTSSKPFKRRVLTEEMKTREAKSKFFSAEVGQYSDKGLVIVDWLTLSFKELDPDLSQLILSEIYDILYESSVSVIGRGRGLYNYTSSAQLKVLSDVGLDVSIGNLAHCEKQGIMLELSGRGCEQLRPFFKDLYVLAQMHGARITRLDLALDLDSDYCKSTGFTVPAQGALANSGIYASKFSSKKQTINTAGAWNDLIFNGINFSDYDPEKHCHGGLTLYVGANTSENQIVLYEKGKQLLGGISESDLNLIMSDYRRVSERKRNALINQGFDPFYIDKLSWVRIERRIRRGGHKKDIPLQFLLDPDSAFCLDFPHLEAVYSAYAKHVQSEMDLVEYRSKRKINDKNILVAKKIFWAKRQYGRLVKTLLHEGFTAEQVCDSLTRATLLKDYVFDIQGAEEIQPFEPETFEFEDYLGDSERQTVNQVRASYLAGSDNPFSYRKSPLYTRLVNARVN